MFLLLLSIPIINVLLLNVFEHLLGKRNSFVFVTHSSNERLIENLLDYIFYSGGQLTYIHNIE